MLETIDTSGLPSAHTAMVHGYRAFVRGTDYFQHLRLAGQRQFRHQRLGHLCLRQEQGQADHQRCGGAYGSTIRSYSITTSPNVGSASAASYTTGLLYSSGTITVTAKITDSRGRTATKTTAFSVYAYSAPYFSSVESYRCNSSGTRDDVNGTYARILATFGRSTLNGSNNVSCRLVMTQIGGSYSTSATLTSGTAVILGGGNLAVDASYNVTLTLTDTVGTVSTYALVILLLPTSCTSRKVGALWASARRQARMRQLLSAGL